MPNSENTLPNENNNQQGEATGENSSMENFQPITSQEEFDKRISNRLKRQQKIFDAQTKELTEKATKWEELQEANKSDLEKANDKVANLEAQLNTYKRNEELAQWRSEIEKETGVPGSLLRGESLEEMKAHAEQLSTFVKGDAAPVVRSDGFAPSKGVGKTTAEMFANAIDGLI